MKRILLSLFAAATVFVACAGAGSAQAAAPNDDAAPTPGWWRRNPTSPRNRRRPRAIR
jgi:ABC-type glycerol-3-phosphate transport system substrate-binding protein